MTSDSSYENRVQEVSQISRQLKLLARDLDVPILAMSQLSRAVEQRHDKRPILSDLRESGSIEQDADLVAFVYRDEYYNEESDQQGLAEIILAKHRNGPTDSLKLSFLKRYAKFADLAAAADVATSRSIWIAPRATAFTAVCDPCLEDEHSTEAFRARACLGCLRLDAKHGSYTCGRGHQIRVERADTPSRDHPVSHRFGGSRAVPRVASGPGRAASSPRPRPRFDPASSPLRA